MPPSVCCDGLITPLLTLLLYIMVQVIDVVFISAWQLCCSLLRRVCARPGSSLWGSTPRRGSQLGFWRVAPSCTVRSSVTHDFPRTRCDACGCCATVAGGGDLLPLLAPSHLLRAQLRTLERHHFIELTECCTLSEPLPDPLPTLLPGPTHPAQRRTRHTSCTCRPKPLPLRKPSRQKCVARPLFAALSGCWLLLRVRDRKSVV